MILISDIDYDPKFMRRSLNLLNTVERNQTDLGECLIHGALCNAHTTYVVSVNMNLAMDKFSHKETTLH